MTSWKPLRSDVIVIGSGPGGATVARELARAGKRVLLVERGQGSPFAQLLWHLPGGAALLGSWKPALHRGRLEHRPSLDGGRGHEHVLRCAALPPAWMKARYGVDLDAEAAEAETELGVAPLPPEMRGAASTRLAEAAGEVGYPFFPQPKFMSPARAKRFPRD